MSPYETVNLGGPIRFYTSRGLQRAARLESEEYARARSSLATFCVDGLPYGWTTEGHKAIVLAVRADSSPADGPFRNEPWVIGGKWDMVTPLPEFVHAKAQEELFDGTYDGNIAIGTPIGNQLFATGWGAGTDGPYGLQGVTLQFCYHIKLSKLFGPDSFRPNRHHSRYLILRAGRELPPLHPYIRDIITMSGWLQ